MIINIFIASFLSESAPKHFSTVASRDSGIAKDKVSFSDSVGAKNLGVSVLDRAVNYGDGCFTSIYCENGKVFILDQHLLRLEHDAHKLGIKFCTETLRHWLIKACESLLLDHKVPAIAIKILVSRGSGGRGYEPPIVPVPQIVISFYPTKKLNVYPHITNIYKYRVEIASMALSTQPLLAGIKHLNRLEQVFAKQELQTKKCDDLLLCDQNGNLIEATAANVFYLRNQTWITPEINNCGVSGVMRKCILEYFQIHKIPYEIRKTGIQDILDAESVFLCNAIKFVIPVASIETKGKTVNYNVSLGFQTLAAVYAWLKHETLFLSRTSA